MDRTEYRVTYSGPGTYNGEPVRATFPTRAEVDEFIAEGVSFGNDPGDYCVDHRTVTYNEWALTTPWTAP